MGTVVDRTGQRFGRLVALKYIGGSRWRCKCDCGAYTTPMSQDLKCGKTQSCGCLHKEEVTKHGLGGTKCYNVWRSMMDRCYNKEHHAYHNYGGRGITVCDQWHDVINFKKDMGDPPDKLTIERIDNNKEYSPDNCRWATRLEQGNNVRANLRIEFNGRTQTASQWARELGLDTSTICKRYHKGKPIEEVLYPGNLQADGLWSGKGGKKRCS